MTDFPGFEYFADQAVDEAEMATWYQFDEYQDFTDGTAIYPDHKPQEYLMLGLMSEVGEMASKMKKEIRDGTEFTTEDFVKELGDILWYVAQLASFKEVYLSEVAQANVAKLQDRLNRDALGGSGDDR
jgi:NTP pyrophosphatase (non-canonical NTP hydrolase)